MKFKTQIKTVFQLLNRFGFYVERYKYTTLMKQKVKININSFTLFKTDFKMNPKSLENLTGKSKRGFMNRQSSNQLRQIVYNALETTRLQTHDYEKNKNKKTEPNNALPHMRGTSPNTKLDAAHVGSASGSAQSEKIEANLNESGKNTEGGKWEDNFPSRYAQRMGKPLSTENIADSSNKLISTLPMSGDAKPTRPPKVLFFTLTTNWDSTELENERQLFKAFRWFCKKLGHSYLWKCEKDTEAHQHFHLLVFCQDINTVTSDVTELWCATIGRHLPSSIERNTHILPVDLSDVGTSIRLAHYFAKQTQFPIDGKIFSMSNDMQRFKPLSISDENEINKAMAWARILAVHNPDDLENSKWTVYQSSVAEERAMNHFTQQMTRLKTSKA